MADLDQIEQELRHYLQGDERLSKQDKLIQLRAIFDKHFASERTEHLILFSDLKEMIDSAKMLYSSTSLPVKISKKEVTGNDINYVFILEAFIGYLNKHKLLKRMIDFDNKR